MPPLTPGQVDKAMYMTQWLCQLYPQEGEARLAVLFVRHVCKPQLCDKHWQTLYQEFMVMMAQLRAWIISRDAAKEHARQVELLIQQANEIGIPHGWPQIIGTCQLTTISSNTNSLASRTLTLTPSCKSAPITSKQSSGNSSKTATPCALVKLVICKDILKKLKGRKVSKSWKIPRFCIICSKKVPTVAASLKSKRTPYNLRGSRLRPSLSQTSQSL
ncbi:hypothetical protein FRC10_011595 [Ceratobasidium sp. 414]|nr:hypothetical protein FRC10_011595 [Ceratobasidium sp. 414]